MSKTKTSKKRKIEIKFESLEKKVYLHLKKKKSYIVKESRLSEIWIFETLETLASIKKKIKDSVKKSEYEDAEEMYHDTFEFDFTEYKVINHKEYYQDEWFDSIIPDKDFKRLSLNEDDDRWKMLQDIEESGEYDLEDYDQVMETGKLYPIESIKEIK